VTLHYEIALFYNTH